MKWNYIIIITALMLGGIMLINALDNPVFTAGQKEVVVNGTIYANNSNIIMSSPETYNCIWYPNSDKKGSLKTCELITEFNNTNNVKSSLTGGAVNYTNLEKYSPLYSFSNTYTTDKDSGARSWSNWTAMPSSIDTSKMYAIKAVLDMPRYEARNYNVTLAGRLGGSPITLELDPTISACGTLSSAGTYTFNQSIVGAATCLTITSNNVTIDGAGYSLNYSGTSTYGITTNGYNNTIIKNLKITGLTTSSGGNAVYMINSTNLTIWNNSISEQTSGVPGSHAVELIMCPNPNITGNNISTLIATTGAGAIDLFSTSNAYINGNNLTGYYGVYPTGTGSSVVNETIINNVINATMGLIPQNNSNIAGNAITAVSYGIYFLITGTTNSTVNGNNITATGGLAIALSGYNNTITNNNATGTTYGIDILSGAGQVYSNNISNNAIKGATDGFAVFTSTNWNNIINYNNITSTGAGSSAIFLANSMNYTLTGNSALSSGTGTTYGIYLNKNCNNTYISDCISVSGGTADVNYSFSGNITVVNCSYVHNNETISGTANVLRKWYYAGYANWSNGTIINGANILGWNSSGSLQVNATTGATGYTPLTTIIDYYANSTSKYYYSPYQLNATYSGTNLTNSTYNATLMQNNYKHGWTFTAPAGNCWVKTLHLLFIPHGCMIPHGTST